jgi:hypothetical protein
VNGLQPTIIGVMAPGMKFPPNSDLWMPLGQTNVGRVEGRRIRSFQLIGRLANGVTLGQAREEISAIAGRLAQEYPETNQDLVPDLTRIRPVSTSLRCSSHLRAGKTTSRAVPSSEAMPLWVIRTQLSDACWARRYRATRCSIRADLQCAHQIEDPARQGGEREATKDGVAIDETLKNRVGHADEAGSGEAGVDPRGIGFVVECRRQ